MPAAIKMRAVILLAQNSNSEILPNALPTSCVEKASRKAKPITGIAVPMPYKEGMMNAELCTRARENRLPKNSAADTGQNDRANTTPRRPAPQIPVLSMRCCILPFKPPEPGMLSFIISSRKIPMTMSTGPSTIFMYFWRKFATSGISCVLEMSTAPNTT